MAIWFQAWFWGTVAGAANLIGAMVGVNGRLPRRYIGIVMGFGAGVLVSALAFDLMEEAFALGGLFATTVGFLIGAIAYSVANWWIARRGAKHRKRSSNQQTSEHETPGSGSAMVVGALLDGIPESIAIGLSFLAGEGISVVMLGAVFISNLPEGLAGATGMVKAGRSKTYVYALWGGYAVVAGLAALMGTVIFSSVGPGVIAATTGIAAGAVITMLADTMMPEAFEDAHSLTGIATALGFWCAFVLEQWG